MRSALGFFVVATSLCVWAQTNVREWHVQLADEANTPLTVSRNLDQLEFRDQKKVVLSVPVDGITNIFLMTQRYNRARHAEDYFDQRCCPEQPASNKPSDSVFQTNVLPILAAAIAAPLVPQRSTMSNCGGIATAKASRCSGFRRRITSRFSTGYNR